MKPLQLRRLAAFVTKRNDNDLEAWRGAPQAAVEGAMVYDASQCSVCHVLNGAGRQVGPTLNGVGDRRARTWVEGHFGDPKKFSPGSTMPAFHFSAADLDKITSYLMQIPK